MFLISGSCKTAMLVLSLVSKICVMLQIVIYFTKKKPKNTKLLVHHILVSYYCDPHVLFIQETHKLYLQKLNEISKLQSNCSSSISRQRRRLKDVSRLVKK